MRFRAAKWAALSFLFVAAATAAETPPEGAAVPADSFPVATDARLGGDDSQTRFVLEVSRKTELRAFTLADPYRVVIDLPQVTFSLPPKTGDVGRGLIKAFRFGLVMAGGSRIVFDLTKPARIEAASVTETAPGGPARMSLELTSTDRESFLRRAELDTRPARADAAPPVPAAASGDTRSLVVLDPGHGGIDTGTKGPNGETEKDIVLKVAERLRQRIEKAGKYRVLMTRTDDTFVPLADRVRFARRASAALFVSIHADALPRREGDAQGASVYTLSDTASDSEAARLAEQENRADIIAGVNLKTEPEDVAGILLDLAERETKGFSLQFARKVLADLKTATRLHKEPLKSAGFRVLRAPDIPSVLIELGYVSNHSDLQSLLSDAWQNRTADSIAQAVDSYFATHVAGARAGAN
ncbi:MAG TPA: N-acetylmuramoyl-L-alanine amidase [Xanthobacteraceae bacterium]|nr:N-acetylmuramoyl-L-alanine amidase [Xanthobacteraceae bacterium]